MNERRKERKRGRRKEGTERGREEEEVREGGKKRGRDCKENKDRQSNTRLI